jgi:hypothetical protein
MNVKPILTAPAYAAGVLFGLLYAFGYTLYLKLWPLVSDEFEAGLEYVVREIDNDLFSTEVAK